MNPNHSSHWKPLTVNEHFACLQFVWWLIVFDYIRSMLSYLLKLMSSFRYSIRRRHTCIMYTMLWWHGNNQPTLFSFFFVVKSRDVNNQCLTYTNICVLSISSRTLIAFSCFVYQFTLRMHHRISTKTKTLFVIRFIVYTRFIEPKYQADRLIQLLAIILML